MPWTIEFFKTERGSIPVMDSMRTLPKRVGTRLANDIDLLEEYGLQLDSRYIKKLKGTGARVDLWELRTRSGNLRVRTFLVCWPIVGLYCCTVSPRRLAVYPDEKSKQQ